MWRGSRSGRLSRKPIGSEPCATVVSNLLPERERERGRQRRTKGERNKNVVPPFRNENRKQAPFTEIVHSRHRPLGPWFTCSLCVHFAASTVGPAVRGCCCGSITAKDSFCFVPVDLFVLCLCACAVAASLSRFSFLSLTQSSRSLARFCSEFMWQLVWHLLSVLSDFSFLFVVQSCFWSF